MGDALRISPEAAKKLFGAMYELAKQEAILDAYENGMLTGEIRKAEDQMTSIIQDLLSSKHGLTKEQIEVQFSNQSLMFDTNFDKYDTS